MDDERIQAQIDADAAALTRIYADDFIGIGPSGTVRTKPQVISDFTSRELKFQSITTDDVRVRVYGNTAVETGRSTMIGQDKGKAVATGCKPLLSTDYAVSGLAREWPRTFRITICR
jgi:hypothetical protein